MGLLQKFVGGKIKSAETVVIFLQLNIRKCFSRVLFLDASFHLYKSFFRPSVALPCYVLCFVLCIFFSHIFLFYLCRAAAPESDEVL